MALSVTRYTGDGVRRAFTFSFTGVDKGYLRDSDVYVFVDNKEVDFRFTSPSSVELLPTVETPVMGAEVEIRRIMPKDKNFAEFKKGNNFRESVLNNSFLQLLYLVHELLDGYFSGDVEFQNDVVFLNKLVALGEILAENGLFSKGADMSNPLSVLNLREADGRYIKATGGDATGIVSFLAGAVSKAVLERPDALVTKGYVDGNFLNTKGGKVSGLLDLKEADVRVRKPTHNENAVDKGSLDAVETELAERLASSVALLNTKIEEVLTGAAEGGILLSENPPVLWHKREVTEPIIVAEDSEARTFGDKLTVQEGVTITVGEGSTWKFIK